MKRGHVARIADLNARQDAIDTDRLAAWPDVLPDDGRASRPPRTSRIPAAERMSAASRATLASA
jgi:hypothetical protein